MLYKSKGKYKWKRKATYATSWSLDPVILAYLEKLKDCLEKAKCCGVPIRYCDQQAKIEGFEKYDWDTDIDLDAAHVLRLKELDELIWVFSDNEPKIKDYNFHIEMINGETDEKGLTPVTFKVENEVEHERYRKDCDEWWKRKEKGHKLFGEIYNELQW